MLIAWGDHEARGIRAFVTIPLYEASALIWCVILHPIGELRAFFGF